MDWSYLVFNAIVVIGPLAVLLTRRGSFGLLARPFAIAYGLVALPWVLLDAFSHWRGWWEYNPDYTLGPRLLGLPFEEVLFFVTVPFACTVLYVGLRQALGRQLQPVPVKIGRGVLARLSVALLVLAVIGHQYERTLVDVVLSGGVLLALWFSPLMIRRDFWLWNGLVLVLFIVCNSWLAGLPVVSYSDAFMTGWRVGVIPIEDFLYNFSLLNLFLLVFLRYQNTQKSSAAE